MDVRRNFLAERVVKHWNGLPRAVVESPHLEVLEKYAEVELGSLLWWWTCQY